MPTTETNIYPILNVNELSSRFRLYRVRGLRPDQPEFHQNCIQLRRLLARAMSGRPVEVLKRTDAAYLALDENCPQPPETIVLVRGQASFEPTEKTIDVDFTRFTPETERLAVTLLQSCVQNRLNNDRRLWRPGSGGLFFEKRPQNSGNEVSLHQGFVVRVVSITDGRVGFCVDARSKFIATRSLSPRLRAKDFGRYKMQPFIYKYGHNWYEVQLADISEFDVRHYLCGETRAKMPLLDWIYENCTQPLPKEITNLDKEGCVVEYETFDGERRGAPAELCYQVFDTQTPQVRREHHRSIMYPHDRREEIADLVRTFLSNCRLGEVGIKLASSPFAINEQRFQVPDYKFGGGVKLSLRGTQGAQQTNLSNLGRSRLQLLENRTAGFFAVGPLYRQHFFMPASVKDSWGPTYLTALRECVDNLYPQEKCYDPKLVVYDDRHATNFYLHGQAIVKAAEDSNVQGGFAIVMLADRLRRVGSEDDLAAFVMRKFAERDIIVSTTHTSSAQEFYELNRHANRYEPRFEERSRLRGYLRNVALNKVLLTSSKWPFVLATALNADVIVGIDVKGNTAGFTAVNKNCEVVFMRTWVSRQKEKLLAEQCRQYLATSIKEIAAHSGCIFRKIAVHRDGRLFDAELEGIKQTFTELQQEGVIAQDASLTCLEIPKTSFTSVRLFESMERGREIVFRNPEIGTHLYLGSNDGYLCTTGHSFLRRGTVKPLHIRRVYGDMSREAMQVAAISRIRLFGSKAVPGQADARIACAGVCATARYYSLNRSPGCGRAGSVAKRNGRPVAAPVCTVGTQ